MKSIVKREKRFSHITSTDLAAMLRIRHDRVLEQIRRLIADDLVTLTDIRLSSYRDSYKRQQPMYKLNHRAAFVMMLKIEASIEHKVAIVDAFFKNEIKTRKERDFMAKSLINDATDAFKMRLAGYFDVYE